MCIGDGGRNRHDHFGPAIRQRPDREDAPQLPGPLAHSRDPEMPLSPTREQDSRVDTSAVVGETQAEAALIVDLDRDPARPGVAPDIKDRLARDPADLIKYDRIEGEAAFYGPKIDIKIEDAIGRIWQLGTIQVDWNLPERFELEYTGEDNQKHRPVMIHRALFGSIERFFGLLIEHYAGAFPMWLAPVQVAVLPIKDRIYEYA